MRHAHRRFLALPTIAILIGSCVGTEAPTGVDVEDVVFNIPINPALIPSPADAGALPINRIRARVERASDNVVLGETMVEVDPSDAEWEVVIDARVRASGDTVMVYVVLIHAEGAAETVEFSGLVGPLGLSPGEIRDATDVPIVRGPIENLFVTGLSITAAPDTLMEGATATLEGEVTTSGEAPPAIFWTVLDSITLSSAEADVTGLMPGVGRVVASAGAFTDTASIVVTQAPATVIVTPSTTAVIGVGAQAMYQAEVLDPRGDPIVGEGVVWRSGTPTLITSRGDGLFEALAVGTGIVEAAASSDASVVGTAEMVVGSSPADVSVTKSVSASSAEVADTVDYEIVVTNGSQDVLVGITVEDSIPAGLTVESTSPQGASADGATWTWTLDTLAVGASDTIDVRVSVDVGTPDGTLTNVVLVAPPGGSADPDPVDNRAEASFDVTAAPVGGPDVRVSMTANDSTPAEGDTVQVSVLVENLDVSLGEDVTNLVVMKSAQSLPAIVSSVPTQGTFDQQTGAWSVGSLAIDESASLTLDVEVPIGTAGQMGADSAWVASLDQVQLDFTNDTAFVQSVVQQAQVNVAVLKTVDEPQPLADSSVVFTVSVVNEGARTATDVTVFDTLPGAFLAPMHTVSTGALVNDSLWTIPLLAPGDTATWSTTTTVATGVGGGSATNTALLRSIAQNDTTPANDTAVVVVNFPVSAVPVVQITAPADGSVYDPGDQVSFTATANDAEQGDLSSSIDWESDVDGSLAVGAAFSTTQLSTGVHTISATATDVDGGMGADTIQITIALITTPQTLNVPFGGTASLPITLSEPAQSGGLTLSVISADPSTTAPTTSTVFIAGGALSANASLQGLQPGTTEVTVSHPQFGASITTVSVTAELNIVQASLTVPEPFPQPIDIRLESLGSPIAAPVGGLDVTLTSADPTCVTGPGSVTITEGLVQTEATLSYGGSAQLPCSAWVGVTAPSVVPDSINVSVQPAPGLSVSPTTVGSGLQYGNFRVTLGTTQHDGVTVRIESQDSSVMRVSPNASTEGTGFIDVVVPDGQNRANYYVHGMEGQTGVVPLLVSAPGFTSNNGASVTVVQPAFDITGPSATGLTSFSPDQVFQVRVGVPFGTTQVSPAQAVRIGGTTLTATVTSSDAGVGELTTLTDSVSPVTVDIAPGRSASQGNVPLGGVAFNPNAAGSTTVSATIPGLVAQTLASRDVTVSAPGISVGGTTVGAGLQYGNFRATLGATQHGGVTVRIESQDPSVMRVSPNATTEGTAFIDVVVPDGQNRANYYVHGMEGQTGVVPLLVSAPGFTSNNDASVTVVPPAFDMSGPSATGLTTFSPDQTFQVRVGVPFGTTQVSPAQAVRIGGTTLTATVTSSDPGVGELITLPDSVSPVTVDIAPGASSSAGNVALGGVAFSPNAAGSTTVSATIPGLVAQSLATRDVTVSAPGISVGGTTVGAGLQYGNFRATLGATQHGGVTVRIESQDPSVMRVSPNATTEGTAFIDVVVPDGQNRANYYVHGMEGQTGVVPLLVSAPGFTSNNDANITVVQPAFDLTGPSATGLTTFSPDQPFQVRVGVPFGTTQVSPAQAVRIGGTTLTATVTSSEVGVGQLTTLTDIASPVTVDIVPGSSTSGNSVANGGVAFDPLGFGSTTVSATIPGLVAQALATRDVTVSAPGITVGGTTVGAGLQYGNFRATLGATLHGGVTVTLTSSNPSVFLVSPDAATEGTESIDVFVADGQNRANYYVHGVEGAEGTVGLTVTADGFIDGTTTVTVVPPALDIVGLSTSYPAGSAERPFYARLGVPNAGETGLTVSQALRIGGTPLTVTFTSSDTDAGNLVTSSGSGASIQLVIQPGAANTPTSTALGGVALEPVAAGSTQIQGTAPGVITTTNGIRTVTITP